MAFNALIHKHRYVWGDVLVGLESLDCWKVHGVLKLPCSLILKSVDRRKLKNYLRVLQQLAFHFFTLVFAVSSSGQQLLIPRVSFQENKLYTLLFGSVTDYTGGEVFIPKLHSQLWVLNSQARRVECSGSLKGKKITARIIESGAKVGHSFSATHWWARVMLVGWLTCSPCWEERLTSHSCSLAFVPGKLCPW